MCVSLEIVYRLFMNGDSQGVVTRHERVKSSSFFFSWFADRNTVGPSRAALAQGSRIFTG